MAAGSIVAPLARLGLGYIVNHAASVDHDCVIGNFCNISPGARLCGGVHVGDELFVGASAVVVQHVASGSIVMGVPAS